MAELFSQLLHPPLTRLVPRLEAKPARLAELGLPIGARRRVERQLRQNERAANKAATLEAAEAQCVAAVDERRGARARAAARHRRRRAAVRVVRLAGAGDAAATRSII